ncbi:MAG: hypothetical protein WC322_05180 [Candidatus Paceibacterota bacterium]|jgi:hypothetical protein
MHKFFRIPFATSGDKSTVPDAADGGGTVSYAEGYGFDYQRPETDPNAKYIERDKNNQLWFDITSAVSELQAQGVPDWISPALNGGVAYSYAENALVRWTDGEMYLSLVPANTATPDDPEKWLPFPKNASLLQYTPAGIGAVPMPAQTKLRERVSVTDFGAIGDSNIDSGGGMDSTAAINLAAAHCVATGATLTAPTGQCFRITSAIDLRGVQEIDWQGQIYCDGISSAVAVTIGGFSGGGGRKKFYFNEIHDGGSRVAAPTNPLLRVFGLKISEIDVRACRYIEIYADASVPGCDSNAYNVFNLGHVYKIQLRGADSSSWITENVFNEGRHSVINIGTTTTEYKHNHNIWTFPTLEGAIQINIQAGAINRLFNVRFEGIDVAGTQITFSSAAYENWIISQYDTDPFGTQFPYEPVPYTRVSDSGQNNLIFKDVQSYFQKVPLFSLDARTPTLTNGTPGDSSSVPTSNQRGLFDRSIPAVLSDCVGMRPGLDWLQFNFTFRDIFTSEYIPVSVGDPFGVEFECDVALMRYSIRCYDAKFTLLGAEGAGGAYIGGSSLSYNGAGKYDITGNLPSTDTQISGAYGFAIRRAEVKYVRVTLATGSVTGKLRRAAIYFFEKPNLEPAPYTSAVKDFRNLTLPSIPTAGYVRRGTMVSKEDGTSIYICTFSFETTLNGALSSGATSIIVNTIGSVANGDIVGLLLDSGVTHWSVVSGLSGSTLRSLRYRAPLRMAIGSFLIAGLLNDAYAPNSIT